MKKILIMHHALVVGGVEKVLLDMLSVLDRNKYRITLLLVYPADWDSRIPSDIDVHYMFAKDPRKRGGFIARLYKYIQIGCPSILYRLFGVKGHFDIAIAYHEPMIWYLPCTRTFTVSWIHSDYAAFKWFPEVKELKNKNGLLAKWITKKRLKLIHSFDKAIFVAQSAIPGYLEKTNFDVNKTIVCYNINDEAQICAKASETISDECWNNYNGFHLVAVGRIHSHKAMQRLIPLMLHLKEACIDAQIYIIGDGPEREQLKALIKKNHLEQDIFLLGYSANPFKYVSRAKLLICTSVTEAYCTATKESIILETPFVTTLCSGMEEQINGTCAGLIAPNGDDTIAPLVIRALTDEELYAKMKKDVHKRHVELSDKSAISNIQLFFDNCCNHGNKN